MNSALGISIALFAAVALNSSRGNGPDKSKPSSSSRADSVAIVRTAARFHSAIERGDTTTPHGQTLKTIAARLSVDPGDITSY